MCCCRQRGRRSRVADALRGHQERMRDEEHEFTAQLLVFVNKDARPIRKSNLRRRSFHPLLKEAGIPRIRLHDLRHTAASLMLLDGIHPKVVQERLGHARVSITLDLYSHTLPRLDKDAADKIDAMLNHG